MAKKKRNERNKSSLFVKEVDKIDREEKIIEKEVEKDVEEIDKWITERRKFLIKLGIVVIFIILLLLFSHFFLK